MYLCHEQGWNDDDDDDDDDDDEEETPRRRRRGVLSEETHILLYDDDHTSVAAAAVAVEVCDRVVVGTRHRVVVCGGGENTNIMCYSLSRDSKSVKSKSSQNVVDDKFSARSLRRWYATYDKYYDISSSSRGRASTITRVIMMHTAQQVVKGGSSMAENEKKRMHGSQQNTQRRCVCGIIPATNLKDIGHGMEWTTAITSTTMFDFYY